MKLRHQAGFTLVEVLVALAVVATALAAGLQASGTLTRMAERQSQQWLARLCANNALVHLRLQVQLPDVGTQSMECTQANTTMQVRLTVTTTPNPSFRRVMASVAAAGSSEDTALMDLATVVGRY